MRETLYLRLGQQLVYRYAFQRNPQSRAVAQTPVTQRDRRFGRFHRGSPFFPVVSDTLPWSGWLRETAGGPHRTGPAPRPAAIPIRNGDMVALPESAPPRTRRKRGNGRRAGVRAPGPRGGTWQAGPAGVQLHPCHGAWCGPHITRTGVRVSPLAGELSISCADRHCPKCLSLARERRIQDRQSELLPAR
jgi:hypothetical protein